MSVRFQHPQYQWEWPDSRGGSISNLTHWDETAESRPDLVRPSLGLKASDERRQERQQKWAPCPGDGF